VVVRGAPTAVRRGRCCSAGGGGALLQSAVRWRCDVAVRRGYIRWRCGRWETPGKGLSRTPAKGLPWAPRGEALTKLPHPHITRSWLCPLPFSVGARSHGGSSAHLHTRSGTSEGSPTLGRLTLHTPMAVVYICDRDRRCRQLEVCYICIMHLYSVFDRPPTLSFPHLMFAYLSLLCMPAPLCAICLEDF
jgi:hypothetical protein